MTRPTVGNAAEDLYEALAPLAWNDEALDWSLLLFAAACAYPLEQLDGYVRDEPTLGLPGWGVLFDVDNAPEEALAYLAQFVGVTLRRGENTDQSRARVRAVGGFKRGTIGAMREAAQLHLTGTKTVGIRERYDPNNPTADSAYHMEVTVITSEAADLARVEAAVRAQKPAGIVLHFRDIDGQDWETLAANYATWADVAAAYDTWADVADDTP